MPPLFHTEPTNFPIMKQFTIRYFAPYGGDWRTQSFSTLKEAEAMIKFYQSCGSKCYLMA